MRQSLRASRVSSTPKGGLGQKHNFNYSSANLSQKSSRTREVAAKSSFETIFKLEPYQPPLFGACAKVAAMAREEMEQIWELLANKVSPWKDKVHAL